MAECPDQAAYRLCRTHNAIHHTSDAFMCQDLCSGAASALVLARAGRQSFAQSPLHLVGKLCIRKDVPNGADHTGNYGQTDKLMTLYSLLVSNCVGTTPTHHRAARSLQHGVHTALELRHGTHQRRGRAVRGTHQAKGVRAPVQCG